MGAADLIYPMFMIEGSEISEDVPSMPGVQRHSIDRLVEAGIGAILNYAPITPHAPGSVKSPLATRYGRNAT